MKSIYFVQKGEYFEAAHRVVENEYMTRRILAPGKSIPKPDEYIIVFDIEPREIVGVLGIIKEKGGMLPFQESFSGVSCEKGAIEFGRFVIKRMINIKEKVEIGKKIFEAALNWCILKSRIHGIAIDCYVETQKHVIDFFKKVTGKTHIFYPLKKAVYRNESILAKNSIGFIRNAKVYKINIVNLIYPVIPENQKAA